jgi:hypothetical protein
VEITRTDGFCAHAETHAFHVNIALHKPTGLAYIHSQQSDRTSGASSSTRVTSSQCGLD